MVMTRFRCKMFSGVDRPILNVSAGSIPIDFRRLSWLLQTGAALRIDDAINDGRVTLANSLALAVALIWFKRVRHRVFGRRNEDKSRNGRPTADLRAPAGRNGMGPVGAA